MFQKWTVSTVSWTESDSFVHFVCIYDFRIRFLYFRYLTVVHSGSNGYKMGLKYFNCADLTKWKPWDLNRCQLVCV